MKSKTVDCGAESCVIRLEMGGKCETDQDGRPDLDVRLEAIMMKMKEKRSHSKI